MTAIKICGITNLEDARAACEYGCDYLGFNFYLPSPRYIEPADCAKITSQIASRYPTIKLVGVFVDESPRKILRILEICQLQLAQLHGNEPEVDLEELCGRGYKAFRGQPPETVDKFWPARTEPAFLLDAAMQGAFGGTGKTGNWEVARSAALTYPLFLAGGLTPENVAGAIREVMPWGVDTASGVEALPGKKDPIKMKAFIAAVRDVG